MDEHVSVGTTDRTSTTEAEVVVSREQLAVSTQWHEAGRVRVAKRVVTEQRTVTVRREVLVVEEVVAGQQVAGDGVRPTSGGESAPVLELTLSEEEVRTVVVPRERVRVYVDRVSGTQQVTGTVAREQVELIESPDENVLPHHDRGVPS